jgi:hypothetical protein
MLRYVEHMGGFWSLTERDFRVVLESGECQRGFELSTLGRRLSRRPYWASRLVKVTDWSVEDYRREMLKESLLCDFRMKLGTLSIGGYWRRTGMRLEVGQYVFFLERFDGKWRHAVVEAIDAGGLVRARHP